MKANSQKKTRAANAVIGEDPSFYKANKEPKKVYAQNGVNKETDSSQDTISVLQKHIADLTRQLQEYKNQKEELEKDIELLCMQQSSSIFDSSMLLTERAFSAEKEVRLLTAQLEAVTKERNDLSEDLRGHRDSKRSAEESWREERARVVKMDGELKFYQEQSARAMSDRDQARWEAEELRKIKLKLEERASKAELSTETAVAAQQDLELRLSEAKSSIEELEGKARECEQIPGLRLEIAEKQEHIRLQDTKIKGLERDLASAESKCGGLEADLDALKSKTSKLEAELDSTQAKAAADANTASDNILNLKARVDELEETNAELEVRVEEAEGNLAASQAETEALATETNTRIEHQQAESMQRQSTMESSYTTRLAEVEMELETTRRNLQDMTQQCEQATREKVETLLRVSQAEQTADQAQEESGGLKAELKECQEREAQAMQEKVAALMQVAALQDQLRGGAAPPTPPSSSRASGWRVPAMLWGTSQPAPKASEAAGDAAKPNSTRANSESIAVPPDQEGKNEEGA